MSPTTAALVLLSAIVTFLVLAMAALRQQVRELQAGTAQALGSSRTPNIGRTAASYDLPTGSEFAIILLVSDGCPTCQSAMPEFVALANDADPTIDYAILSRGDTRVPTPLGRVHHDVNPRAFNSLDPGWQPALATIDSDHALLSMEPVGSPEAIQGGFTKSLERVRKANRHGTKARLIRNESDHP